MKRIVSLVLCLLLVAVMCLPICAGSLTDFKSSGYDRFKDAGITLNVYNWGEYISDGSEDSVDTIKEFEELTGIAVHYTTFASNEEMYAKIKSGGAQYDVIIPSDYMIARMINEGMVEKLDYNNIPNASLVDAKYKGLDYDPADGYSVPYTWGIVGLIYNTTIVDGEVDSWDALWDSKYSGNILMFSNSRDAFGIALQRLGYSLNTTNEDELRAAANELMKQKELVQAYVMDEIFNKMEGGEAAIAPYYVGDAVTMMSENPDLAFAVPKEGTNYFVDAMVIPTGCENKEAAEMFINFMCEPVVSAANVTYIGYATPISAAKELLDIDEEVENMVYVDDEVLAKTEVFKHLPDKTNTLIDELWTEILSYNKGASNYIVPIFLGLAIVGAIAILVVRAKKKNKPNY